MLALVAFEWVVLGCPPALLLHACTSSPCPHEVGMSQVF